VANEKITDMTDVVTLLSGDRIAMARGGNTTNFYTTPAEIGTFVNAGTGTVTSVVGTGSVFGLTLTGTVTTAGTLTLGGTPNIATAATLGVIIAGANTTINAGGTLSVAAPGTGTVTSVIGAGTVGGLTLTGTVTSSGTLTLGGSPSIATSTTLGVIIAGTNTTINAGGTLTVAAPGTGTVTSVQASGGTTGLTFSGGPVTGAGTLTMAGTVALGTIATIATNTALGNVTAGTAAPVALTKTQLTTLINSFTTTLSGAAPASAGGTVNYLRADGTWAAPPGATSGTVTSVVAGTGLSGGTITTAGTLAVTAATTLALGGIIAGANTTINVGGTLSVAAPGTGTVTSITGSGGTTGLTLGGGPITGAGTLTLGGTLVVADGGTGLSAGTSGGILGFTSTSALASSVLLTANALILGGGAAATPTPMGSLGTTTTVLHGNAAGAPTFGAVALASDVSGTLPIANGGNASTQGPRFSPSFSVGATQSLTADTYYFTTSAKYAGTITSAISFVASGTETYTVTINGTNVTGLVSIAETAVVGAPATHSASAANTFAAGAVIGLIVTGTGLGFNVTLNIT
jgi:fibronectin-binding autotransporter adhesin